MYLILIFDRMRLSTGGVSTDNSVMTSHDPWHIYGHDWAVEFLQKGLRHQRIRHAYLITGTEAIGKSTLAHRFAQALNCLDDESKRPCGVCRSCKRIESGNHPDLLYSQTDSTSGALKIGPIREVTRLIALKPYEARYRIAIFHDFDQAQPRAQDALLKTLEEPPAYAVLILLAQSTESIMPTISSRCQILPLRPAPIEAVQQMLIEHGSEEEKASLIARLSSGRTGWALEALRDEEILVIRDDLLNRLQEAIAGHRGLRFKLAEQIDRETRRNKPALRYILEMWQTYWRDVLLLAEQSPVKPCNRDRAVEIQQIVQRIRPEEALTALQATTNALRILQTNANVRMVLEVMFLDYPGD